MSKPIKPGLLCASLAKVLIGLEPSSKRGASPPVFDKLLGERAPLRILLAEDNIVNQRVALRMLERLGYRADLAKNGLEVLEALNKQTYDVLLLDVHMPKMDGLEASREICKRLSIEQRPRIIAMTANAMQGDKEECIAAGMDDYISKPVHISALQRALERAVPARSIITVPGLECVDNTRSI